MLGNVCWIYVLDPPPQKKPPNISHILTLYVTILTLYVLFLICAVI